MRERRTDAGRPTPSRTASGLVAPGQLRLRRFVDRDTATANRQCGLLFPRPAGPDQVAERSTGPPIGHQHRALERELRLAAHPKALPDTFLDSLLADVECLGEAALADLPGELGPLLVRRTSEPRLSTGLLACCPGVDHGLRRRQVVNTVCRHVAGRDVIGIGHVAHTPNHRVRRRFTARVYRATQAVSIRARDRPRVARPAGHSDAGVRGTHPAPASARGYAGWR